MPNQKEYYRRHLPHYQPEGETYHVSFRLAGSIAVRVLDNVQRERNVVLMNGEKNESSRMRFLRQYRRRYLERIEAMLDSGKRGPHWLNRSEIAAIVDEAIHFWDGEKFELIAECIMPNHVHLVIRLLPQGGRRRDGVPSDKQTAGRDSDLSSAAGAPDVRQISDPVEVPNPVHRISDPTAPSAEESTSHLVTDIVGSIKKYSALRANRLLGRRGPFWHPESYDHVIRDGAELDRTIRYVLMNPVKAGLCKDWREWKWTHIKEEYFRD